MLMLSLPPLSLSPYIPSSAILFPAFARLDRGLQQFGLSASARARAKCYFMLLLYIRPGISCRQARAGRPERRPPDRARFNARLYLHNISPDPYRRVQDRGIVIAFHGVRRQNRSDQAR